MFGQARFSLRRRRHPLTQDVAAEGDRRQDPEEDQQRDDTRHAEHLGDRRDADVVDHHADEPSDDLTEESPAAPSQQRPIPHDERTPDQEWKPPREVERDDNTE